MADRDERDDQRQEDGEHAYGQRNWDRDREAYHGQGGTQTSAEYPKDWGFDHRHGYEDVGAQAEGTFPGGGKAGSVSTDHLGVGHQPVPNEKNEKKS
jgi:hypothetical protein